MHRFIKAPFILSACIHVTHTIQGVPRASSTDDSLRPGRDFDFYPCGTIVHGLEFRLCGDRHVLLKLHSSCNFFVIHCLVKSYCTNVAIADLFSYGSTKTPDSLQFYRFVGIVTIVDLLLAFFSFMFSFLLFKQKKSNVGQINVSLSS